MKSTMQQSGKKKIRSLTKGISVLCLFLATQMMFASEIFNYQLAKFEKLEGTYTANIGKGQSIHFAIIKNSDSKNFQLMPFYVDSARKVKKFDTFSAKEMFSILSYHEANGVISVVNYDKDNKQIQFIDYDLATGSVQSTAQEMKDAPDNVFRLNDKTLLVSFDKKKNRVDIKSVSDAHHIESTQISISKENEKLFRSLIDENPDPINQQEFVEKGSILKRKGYLMGDNLVYTMEKGKEEMQVFRFDLNKNLDFDHSTIQTGFSKETKDVSNYLYDNKLVFLGVEKQDISLKTFDATTAKAIKQLSLANDLKGLLPTYVMEEYIKTARKSAIKSTVTVNKTKSGKLAFRLDNVEEAKYYYHYNWYMHHWMFQHQMMMMQQQQMMQQQRMMQQSAARGFGPAPMDDSFIYFAAEKKLPSIEFILDVDFNASDAKSETTMYQNIDKDRYLDIYKDNKAMKNLTSSFTDTDMRYISFNPKTKTLSIAFDPL